MRVRRSLLMGLGIILALSGVPVSATGTGTGSDPVAIENSNDLTSLYEWTIDAGKWGLKVKSSGEPVEDGVYVWNADYYLFKDGLLVTEGPVTITDTEKATLDEDDKAFLVVGDYSVGTGTSPSEGLGKLPIIPDPTVTPSPTPEPTETPTPEPVESLNPGWQKVDGKWLYGNADGTKATGMTGWQLIEGQYYFLNEDGSVDTSKNGIVENAGKYLSASNGVAVFASGFQNINGATYYLNNGDIQRYNGWVSIEGKAYYFNGQNQVSSQNVNGWKKIGSSWYWFENGKTATGWRNIGGKWYYLDPTTGIMKTGIFADTTGQKYYCDGSGAMVGGGWHKIGNDWYWMHNSGAIATGWLKQGNTWYYLEPATGAMKTGWYDVGGQRYFSAGSGAMMTGWIYWGNTWYYLNTSGAMHRGWLKQGNTWYYLEPTTGAMKTGWYDVNGQRYFSAGSGAMMTGWIYWGNTWYYLNTSGAMHKGWANIGGTWYYLDSKTGAMRTGWYQDGNTWYYSYTDGAMASSRWIGDYYVSGSGAMLTNTWIDNQYWVGSDGKWIPNYRSESVAAQSVDGNWERSNGNWYFRDKTGKLVTGWKYIGEYKYYFNSNGVLVQDLDNVIGRQSSYYITVNRAKCQVMVYAKDETGKYCVPVKTFACSVGLSKTPTPTGTFHILAQYKLVQLMGPSWGKYGSLVRYENGIFFHSVACSSPDPTYSLAAGNYNMLGQPASHGCIRLCVRDAKWIYDNCSVGTTVTINDTAYSAFDKPVTIKIPAGQNWDPTDPDVNR